jgi:prepilin-type N-terminal cleavage/methylation domain-containing protein
MRYCLRGFTLVEILMVVAILGIVSAVIIPQIGTRSDLIAGSAARQVMSDMTWAQNRAISTQQPVYVVFTPAADGAATGGSYQVMSALPSTVMTHPVNKSPWSTGFGVAQTAWSQVRIDAADFDGQRAIMFDVMGSPSSIPANGGTATGLGSGTVRVVCNGTTLTIRVEPLTGTLTVQ